MSILDDLGAALAPDPHRTINRRQGVITAAPTGTPSVVSVSVGGTAIAGVRYIGPAQPQINDVVWVDFNGADPLVIGAAVTDPAWASWTPTLGADTTPPTLGASPTQLGRYTRIGRTIIGDLIIYFGGAGLAVGAGAYRFILPTPPVWNVDHRVIGNGYLFDSSAADLKTFQLIIPAGAANFAYGIVHSGGGPVNFVGAATYPWAVGDRLLANFTYEAVT